MAETILIVDDDEETRRLFAAMLSESYAIETAASGAEGLRRARELRPDLVLLDVLMPDMTGVDVCKSLRADPLTADIPVIFVTGLDDAHNEQTGLAAGAVDYCTKPVHAGVLRARVQVHLEHRQYTRYLEALVDERTESLEDARRGASALLERRDGSG